MGQLWRKHGGRATPLPAFDRDAAGDLWTGLETNARGREACGWAEAAPPAEVSLGQFRAALADAGLLVDFDAWVAAQPPEDVAGLAGSERIRRDASGLTAAGAALTWSTETVDHLFLAAEAVPEPTSKVRP